MTTSVFDEYLRNFASPEVDLTIDPRDEMLLHTVEGEGGDVDRALVRYVAEGARTCESMLDVARWRFGGVEEVSLLDFASGFGRVTRHTIRAFSPDRVTVSDIVAEAVAFQSSRFGVRGVVSTERPEDLDLEDRFDLVFVTSLFSHLPPDAFIRWLRRLFEATTERGVLAFSVHDRALYVGEGGILDGPYLFVPVSESRVLEGEQYGTMWVAEEWVRDAIRGIAPEASCHRVPRGLGNFQDLYLVVREPNADFADVVHDAGPIGFVDRGFVEEGALRCSGWAIEYSPCSEVDRVEIWFRGERAAVRETLEPRPDVAAFHGKDGSLPCGFDLVAPLPADVSFAEPVFVVATSTLGRRAHLYTGSIDGLFHRSVKNDLTRMARGDAVAAAAETGRIRELEDRVELLEQTIRAMEASRFWKLRNAWFRLKGAAGAGARNDPAEE